MKYLKAYQFFLNASKRAIYEYFIVIIEHLKLVLSYLSYNTLSKEKLTRVTFRNLF
jgi:hypothetical protein